MTNILFDEFMWSPVSEGTMSFGAVPTPDCIERGKIKIHFENITMRNAETP